MTNSLVSLSSLPKFRLVLQTAGYYAQDDVNNSVLFHGELALNAKGSRPLLDKKIGVSLTKLHIVKVKCICGTNHPLVTPLFLGLPLAEVSAMNFLHFIFKMRHKNGWLVLF